MRKLHLLLTAAWLMAGAAGLSAPPKVVALPGKSPLVSFRFVFLTGSASDPSGKQGAASLTAAMVSRAGTRQLTYKQVVDALFPMAASINAQVDKEMTTFSGVTHIDNLDAYYRLFRAAILEPGWREEDLRRLRDDMVNYIRVGLRSNNDEELGKEVLYETLYAGHPYEHLSVGRAKAIEKLTMTDLQQFHKSQYTQANLIIGLGGGYPPGFLERVKKDFAVLPAGAARRLKLSKPKPINENQLVLVDKNTRAVAYSIGLPIDVNRAHPDYPALLVMQSYLGQHRNSGGRLYDRMREIRGLNYGDYAYIEYFPRGMFQFQPDPNLARQQQIFQIWIRPVEPPTAHFSLRLALFELNKLVTVGIPAADFERTRSFLSNYVNLLTQTKSAELGYAIDSGFYGIPTYTQYLKEKLAKLTLKETNAAIQRHIRADRLVIVAVTRDAARLRDMLLANEPSPMKYNSAKPDEIMSEDAVVEKLKISLRPEAVKILPVDTVFE